jgi:predicted transposase YdaD
MAKPFDATTKKLVETRPADWLALLGITGTPVAVMDADLATVTTDADRVLRIGDPAERLAHLEFESGKDGANVPRRLLRYNALLDYQHGLPVQSAVILLQRESDSPRITGRLERRRADGSIYLTFEYTAVRVWQLDAEALLSGGLATLPLAPLTNVATPDLPTVVRRMQTRIDAEAATTEEAGTLWVATYILLGLKYPQGLAGELLKGVRQMEESVTYQAILAEGAARGRDEGRASEAREIILRLGGKRFGAPSARAAAAIQAITSVERLEALVDRLLEAESWDELLAG